MPEAITASTETPPSAVKPAADTSTDIYSAASEIDDLDDSPESPAEAEKPATSVEKPAKEKAASKEADEGAEDSEVTPETADEEIEGLDDEKPAEKPVEKPTEKDDEKDPSEKQPEEKFGRMKDLKVVYEKTKAEKKELETKLAEASKTIETLKRSNPDEVKALTDRLQKAEARREELEQEIRHVNYQASEEFQTKYKKPYEEAWARAASDLAELTVELADGATRQATADDLVELAHLPLGEARRRAREMFGDAADDVMAHRLKLRELSAAQSNAIAESRKAAKEREQARIVEERAKGEKLRGIYSETVKQVEEKYPRLFKTSPGDDEGNQLLEKGFSEFDRFFNDTNTPMEERVKTHAMLRFKAAAFDRQQLRLVRLAKQLRKAREDLAAYEKSAPPGGGKARATQPKSSLDVFAQSEKEIEALDED